MDEKITERRYWVLLKWPNGILAGSKARLNHSREEGSEKSD